MNFKIFKCSKRVKNDYIFKYLTIAASLLIVAMFLVLIGFILYYSIDGFKTFGIINILFQTDFSGDNYSFWIPFTTTIFTSVVALLISVPMGIFIAIFAKYRLSKSFQKIIIIFFNTLAGIPSVIFGLFAINSLGVVFNTLFGFAVNSIFNASIMLGFMVLPTIVSLTIDSLNSVDNNLINNPLALGNNKSRAIYKVALKAAKNGIIVAIIIALSRAIGESMAMSMILQSAPSNSLFKSGFFEFLNSSSGSIGSYISSTMFSDSDPEFIRPLLYTFGLFMFIFSMCLNMMVLTLTKRKKQKRSQRYMNFENLVSDIVLYVPRQMKEFFESLFFKSQYNYKKATSENTDEYINYIRDRSKNYRFSNVYSSFKIFLEISSILISFSFITWIVGDILVQGFTSTIEDPSNLFLYSKNSVGQSFINTLVIIFLVILIGFPIALLIAIFLNEYSKDGTIKKVILFFMDSLGSTPSIIFGMFGMLLFIETMGLTSEYKSSNSLIAGALTLVLVVVPSFTRMLEQAIRKVPETMRHNSYALGNSKFETLRKVVLPSALAGITTAVISTIGRILSETAPLYLTAGLSSSMTTAFDRPGTTLTTHIYAQIFTSSIDAKTQQYQAALVTLFLILLLIFISFVVIPNKKHIKNWIIDRNKQFREWIGIKEKV